ncbi:hypothetical protein Ccrd_007235, partial [Cynara cardunculus var. scolymus]
AKSIYFLRHTRRRIGIQSYTIKPRSAWHDDSGAKACTEKDPDSKAYHNGNQAHPCGFELGLTKEGRSSME